MTKTEIIQELIKQNDFKSYLEIGLGDCRNFNAVQCEMKVGVDPRITGKNIGTIDSDTFFEHCQDKFDLIFIDGLHHADQVERDIVNSWKWLNKGGIILVHDIYPHDENMTIVPRAQSIWTGDVFRAWYGFVTAYPKIKTHSFRKLTD